MVPRKRTAKEVSFEWSHHRISSTELKVSTTLHVSIIDSGSGGLLFQTGWYLQGISKTTKMNPKIDKITNSGMHMVTKSHL